MPTGGLRYLLNALGLSLHVQYGKHEKQGFPGGFDGKESVCNAGDPGSIPGLRRSPGEGKGYPLQYSGLKNSMDHMYRPWGRKESNSIERLSLTYSLTPLQKALTI